MNNHNIKMFVPTDLYELLEAESKDYRSWNLMLNRMLREYFLHRSLKEEFKKVKGSEQ
ncbi:hypothetical protein D9M68_660690 [compost metagenome]